MQPPVRHMHVEVDLHLVAAKSTSDNVFGNDQGVTQISITQVLVWR